MATEISVPDIGDFESVEIIEILVKPGDTINKNDSIVTLESDKSSVEVPSPFAGKISSLKVKIGDKVSKGNVLALIETEETKPEQESKEQKKEETKPLKQKKEDILPETEKIIKQAEQTIVQKPGKESPKKVYARPNGSDIDPIETKEWLDSLDAVMLKDGSDRAHYLLKKHDSISFSISFCANFLGNFNGTFWCTDNFSIYAPNRINTFNYNIFNSSI